MFPLYTMKNINKFDMFESIKPTLGFESTDLFVYVYMVSSSWVLLLLSLALLPINMLLFHDSQNKKEAMLHFKAANQSEREKPTRKKEYTKPTPTQFAVLQDSLSRQHAPRSHATSKRQHIVNLETVSVLSSKVGLNPVWTQHFQQVLQTSNSVRKMATVLDNLFFVFRNWDNMKDSSATAYNDTCEGLRDVKWCVGS